MASLLLVIVSILVISVSDCYPYGAPACVSAPRSPSRATPTSRWARSRARPGTGRCSSGRRGRRWHSGGSCCWPRHQVREYRGWWRRRLREYDHISRIPVQCSISGELQIEDNANITRVECNGLLGSAGEDTKVNNNFACFIWNNVAGSEPLPRGGQGLGEAGVQASGGGGAGARVRGHHCQAGTNIVLHLLHSRKIRTFYWKHEICQLELTLQIFSYFLWSIFDPLSSLFTGKYSPLLSGTTPPTGLTSSCRHEQRIIVSFI